MKKLDYVRTNNNGLGGVLTHEEIDYKTKTGIPLITNTLFSNTQPNLQSSVNFSGSTLNTAQVNSSNIGNIISSITKASDIPTPPQLPAYAPVSSDSNYKQELKLFIESQQKRRNELEASLTKELNEKYALVDTYYKAVKIIFCKKVK